MAKRKYVLLLLTWGVLAASALGQRSNYERVGWICDSGCIMENIEQCPRSCPNATNELVLLTASARIPISNPDSVKGLKGLRIDVRAYRAPSGELLITNWSIPTEKTTALSTPGKAQEKSAKKQEKPTEVTEYREPVAAEEPVQLKEGQGSDEVEELLGKPEDITRVKETLIYTYPSVKVFFENGKLVNVEERNKK